MSEKYVIGIDLGGTNIAIGIVDENGKILKKGSVPTKADREAIKARTKEFIEAGVDKELAKTMAKAEFEYGIIKPVVQFN